MAERTGGKALERGVLVGIDNDLELLQRLEDQLLGQFQETHDVVTFISAEQALDGLYELAQGGQRVEIVFAALTLPGMQGDRLLEMIRDRFPGTLRVLLAGYTDLEEALYAVRNARLDRYLRVPWEAEDLALSVASLITQHRLRRENETLLEGLKVQNRELEQALRDVDAAKHRSEGEFVLAIQSLAAALEAKDPYTAGHSNRVARFAVLMGRRMGLGEKELEDLRTVALLHDIGKIGMAEAILNKPGVLNQREFDTVRNHPTIGARILSPISRMAPYVLATKHHHERYDGKGYPDGLAGDDLPTPVWIISVCDAFDAMTSTRPYRKAQPLSFAMDQLQKGRGTQFHPECVDALVAILRENQMVSGASASKV